MDLFPYDIPIWANEGEQPSEELFNQGYKLNDVPYSKHLNFMFNKITESFQYLSTGKVHNKFGVFSSGNIVPLSDEGVAIFAEPHTLAYRGMNWYKLTRKNETNKEVTLNLVFPGAFDNLVYNSQLAGVYSVLLHISEPVDPTKAVKITVSDLDPIWASSTVTRLEPRPLGNGTQLVAHRVTLTTTSGASKPAYSNLKMKAVLTNASSTVVTNFDMMRPILYEGLSWFGNMHSAETVNEWGSNKLAFRNSTWNDPIKVPSINKTPLGVSRIQTPTTGTYKGLPLSAKGILFNLASSDYYNNPTAPGAQMVMLDKTGGNAPELYFRTTTSETESKDYSRVLTDTMMSAMLVPYATQAYVDSQLTKYITKTTADSTYVTKVESEKWQKTKITADDGSPLITMPLGSTTTDLATKILANMPVGNAPIVSISMYGDLIWGDWVVNGTTPPNPRVVIGYTSNGTGVPYYLAQATTPFVGFLRGTSAMSSGSGVTMLTGELTGTVDTSTTNEGISQTNMAVNFRIDIMLLPDGQSLINVSDIADATAQIGAFNAMEKNNHITMVNYVKERTLGETIYSGNAGTIGQVLKLSNNMVNFTRLAIQYTDRTTTYVEHLHLPSIRSINVTISLQMQRIIPSPAECYVYELNLSDDAGNEYAGNTLTITGNKRFGLKAGTGTEGSFTRITKIIGYK